MDSNDFIAAARDWIGVKWRHQGRSRGGVDCAGLVVCAFRDIGIEISDMGIYSRVPFNGELQSFAKLDFDEVARAMPGDVFLMSFGTNPVSHAAIFTGDTIIHSYEPRGRVLEVPFRDGRPAHKIATMRLKEWHRQ